MSDTTISQQPNIPASTGDQWRKGVPPQQQPLRRSKRDKYVEAVLNRLNEEFYLCMTPEQTYLIVEKSSSYAFPAEVESIAGRIKSLAFNTSGIDLPRGAIDSAVEIFRQTAPQPCTVEFGHSLLTPNGDMYLLTSNGVLSYLSGQPSFYLPNQLPMIGFLRPENSLLSFDAMGCNIEKKAALQIFDYINIPKDCQLLVIAWIIHCLLPDTPKLLLELVGESRCGKAWAQEVLKRLVDHSSLPFSRDTPQTPKAVHRLAQKDYLISLDQVDELKKPVQHALLHIMQGEVIPWAQKRQRQEAKIFVQSPVILNSYAGVVTEPELADSTLTIELPPLAQARTPFDWASFNQQITPAYQALLAILGDVHASRSAAPAPDTRTDYSAAMNTFCQIGCVVARSLGFQEGVFWEQFDANQQGLLEYILEEQPVAYAIREYVKHHDVDAITETAGKLNDILFEFKPQWCSDNEWPCSPRQLGAAFLKAIPLLKQHDISLEAIGKRGGLRRWRISVIKAPADARSSLLEKIRLMADTLRKQDPQQFSL
jgi:hypothetical protein